MQTMPVIIAALQAAVIWNIVTWYFGIASCSSHALISGLVGTVIVSVGVQAINASGLLTVIFTLLLSPILDLIVAKILINLTAVLH